MTEKPAKKTKKLWLYFIGVLIVLLLLEYTIHPHAVFGMDGTRFFNAWFGFISCAVMVVGTRYLGKVLKRPFHYYKNLEGK